MMEGRLPTAKAKWYQTFWGVFLLGFLCFLLLIVGAIVVLSTKYYWQITHGQIPAIAYQSTQFSSSGAAGAPDTLPLIQLQTSYEPSLGHPGAPITIVEFIDLKCPNCQAEEPIIKQVLQKYGTKFTFMVRNFPIEQLHPGATQLADIAYCAGKQGQFWPLHDYAYANQANLPTSMTMDDIAQLASMMQLNETQLTTCLANPATEQAISKDYYDGLEAGVEGTPTFFVNGQKIEGVIPFSVWDAFFQKLSS